MTDEPTFFEEAFDQLKAEEEEPEPFDEVDEPIKRDIISLLQLGKLQESFPLFGHDFELKTLNMDEELQVEQLLSKEFSSTYNEKGYRTAVVAASLISHNGLTLVRTLTPGENTLPRAYQKVKKWYRPVIYELFETYQDLEERATRALEELKKNS